MNSPTCDQCDCVAGCQANPQFCPNLEKPLNREPMSASKITITRGRRYGGWQTFNVNDHSELIRVVARMEDDDVDLPLGQLMEQFLLTAKVAHQTPESVVEIASLRKELANAKSLIVDVYAMLPPLAIEARRAIDKRSGSWFVWGADQGAVSEQPTPCQHRFGYFGDQQNRRRCAYCKTLEPLSKPVDTQWTASVSEELGVTNLTEVEARQAGYSPLSEQPAAPDIWKLVPVNPTPAMKVAGSVGIGHDFAHHCYVSMIAASPTAQPVQPESTK